MFVLQLGTEGVPIASRGRGIHLSQLLDHESPKSLERASETSADLRAPHTEATDLVWKLGRKAVHGWLLVPLRACWRRR
eukprot:scaffold334_cov241-Pinguiococcus_pyrenoidosus.AAC.16